MKKIFASLLVFIMIFTLIPTKTITLGLWDEPWLPNGTDFFENDIGYSIDNGEAQVTFCNSNDKIINIPKEIRGYPVTKIREYAFSRSEASGRGDDHRP